MAHVKSGRFIVVSLLTVVAFSILVNLGLWQLSRAEEKREIEAKVAQLAAQPALELSQVSESLRVSPTGLKVALNASPVEGRYLLLDNQSFHGEVGYLALQLAQTESEQWVLLERGFVPAPPLRSQLPEVVWLTEPQRIEGRLYRKSVNPLSHELFIEQGDVSRIQNVNYAELESLWGIELERFIVQPQMESWPYPQPWQPVSMNAEKHTGYAVQWFSMAAALVILSLLLLMRTIRRAR